MTSAWDVVVVGAGAAGVLVTERLRARGHRVLLLEAGPRLQVDAKTPDVDRRAWPFSTVGDSFDWYRVRAISGRTLLWGGWCYRLPPACLASSRWPLSPDDLAPYYSELESTLGVVDGILDERYSRAAGSLGLHILPKRGALLDGRPWTPRRLPAARTARIHTVALRLEHRGGLAIAAPTLDLTSETVRSVRARAFILCASPIETARILLESDLGPRARAVGQGLVDHMVASYILLEPAPPPCPGARGPFPGAALVESFVNQDPKTVRPYPGGFSIELTGPGPLEPLNIERMAKPGEEERTRATLIHAIGEMVPIRERFVDLDPSKRDLSGRRVPRIHVAFSQEEHLLGEDMKQACLQLADALAIPGSRIIPFVDPFQAGAGHEAGTCAMGTSEATATDPWGRVRALENVWVADAAALPTSGDRHPTLTVLAHALRAADDASRFLVGRSRTAQ
jgi:choline dehydrogenase-like flavoprotein